MRFSFVFSAVLSVSCLVAAGCGGSGESAPSADELANFVADNPELMEETRRAQADPFDESSED